MFLRRPVRPGRSLPTRSARSSGTRNVTTTVRYVNVKDDNLQELIEGKPLALVAAH